ncbi:MAG: hypothetical protein HY319_04945 [Armatimonadetes bacterium]|nr:hypothetical protein [Armatimonadota bacterium]
MAIASVLGILALLLLFCLLLASWSMMHLQFSQNLREDVRAEQLARAGVAQFAAMERLAAGKSDPLGNPRRSLAERYRGDNLFGDGGARLDGSVSVTFDPASADGTYSVDNSQSSVPAASCLDTGESKSIPPFGVSLILEIRQSGRASRFEAVMQRRWPYAVTSGAQLGIVNARGGGPPSFIEGRVLVVPGDREAPAVNRQPVGLAGLQYSAVLTRDTRVKDATGAVVVGGAAGDKTVGGGNRLEGDADFSTGFEPALGPLYPAVAFASGNLFKGRVRLDVASSDGLMEGLFPDFDRAPLDIRRLQVDPLPGWCEVYRRRGKNFYLLKEGINLCGGLPAEPDPDVTYVVEESGKVLIPGSFGNRLVPDSPPMPGDTAEVHMTNAELTLTDITVYVQGDLDLSGAGPPAPPTDPLEPPPPFTPPALKGSNATVAVQGDLIVNGGRLDAQEQGMVIFCHSLLMRATGLFKGLIMVRDGALFYPYDPAASEPPVVPDGPEQPDLQIQGGLVCGAAPLQVARLGVLEEGEAPEPLKDIRIIRGLTLFGTGVTYDPRYLTTLHQLGGFELKSLRRLR